NFRAGRNESALLSIVAEGALECAAGIGKRFGPAIDHAKWTGDDAVSATVADIVLDEDRANFSSDDCAGRTCFQTACFFAVLANIGEKYPAKGIVRLPIADCRLRIEQTHWSGDLISFLSILL